MLRRVAIFAATSVAFFVLTIATGWVIESERLPVIQTVWRLSQAVVLLSGTYLISLAAARRLRAPWDLSLIPAWYLGRLGVVVLGLVFLRPDALGPLVGWVLTLGALGSPGHTAWGGALDVGPWLALSVFSVVAGISRARALARRGVSNKRFNADKAPSEVVSD